MIFTNGWNFGGEITRVTDFGLGEGGNVKISGLTETGASVDTSVFMSENLFSKVVAHMEATRDKFPKVNAVGHFEEHTRVTSGNNIQHNLRLIADELQFA